MVKIHIGGNRYLCRHNVVQIMYDYYDPPSTRSYGWRDFFIRLDDGRELSLTNLMSADKPVAFEFSWMQWLPIYFCVVRIAYGSAEISYRIGPISGKIESRDWAEVGDFLLVMQDLARSFGRKVIFEEYKEVD